MQAIDMTADDLVSALLGLARDETVCILDSCGVGHLGSHLLIAGISPTETLEISEPDPELSLSILQDRLTRDAACIFTLSYELGAKLLGIGSVNPPEDGWTEPDVFLACFDTLIVFDYDLGTGAIAGNVGRFDEILEKLTAACRHQRTDSRSPTSRVTSNFSKPQYLDAIEEIHELIRAGHTYQTNLTQQLTAFLADGVTAETVFARLRKDHPAPFAGYIRRPGSTVVSASPERFFKISDGKHIATSPIKGTRPRGRTAEEDARLKTELMTSEKDRAENTMIVDLLRNDLGRVCEYGSVNVESLCQLEEHPTLFHLVSTISGKLRKDVTISDVVRALFPCGSITGAPKISTMRIIDGVENCPRGLSMGAIGYSVPNDSFGIPQTLDLSVAIRTMAMRGRTAVFNVGGGIVIDSDPDSEYEESLVKARALLKAIGGKLT